MKKSFKCGRERGGPSEAVPRNSHRSLRLRICKRAHTFESVRLTAGKNPGTEPRCGVKLCYIKGDPITRKMLQSAPYHRIRDDYRNFSSECSRELLLSYSGILRLFNSGSLTFILQQLCQPIQTIFGLLYI